MFGCDFLGVRRIRCRFNDGFLFDCRSFVNGI